ncbi:DUF6884 domain-containing protein [Bacillus cereus]|uniref:DUF6884 domain-containing protein n=1 Tax=Bacillus cereus TaxID=1396 RepID=UPI003100C4AA
MFSKAIKNIEQNNYDNWFILSPKHRLLHKEEIIAPYDLTLNSMKTSERKNWTKLVLSQLEDMQEKVAQIDFYAGTKYLEYLFPALEQRGIACNVPLKGEEKGEQLQCYKENTKKCKFTIRGVN